MRLSLKMRSLSEKTIQLLKNALGGFRVARLLYFRFLRNETKTSQFDTELEFDLAFLQTIPSANPEIMQNLFLKSRSQLRQDLFVLHELDYKKGGFFVEFGATNGIDLNNTYLLEKDFGWTGILAEPAKVWRNDLRQNRPNAIIEERLIWKDSNSILSFNETPIPEFSTIESLSYRDVHKGHRQGGVNYKLRTISLNDLLELHNAPSEIDYLSIDTEGSEYEILSCLNFQKYSFRVITCEHNYSKQRKLIYNLLTKQGYQRKYEEISLFDDWYVKMSL